MHESGESQVSRTPIHVQEKDRSNPQNMVQVLHMPNAMDYVRPLDCQHLMMMLMIFPMQKMKKQNRMVERNNLPRHYQTNNLKNQQHHNQTQMLGRDNSREGDIL